MPYVPSKKTDGKSVDREVLDKAVELLAIDTAEKVRSNLFLIKEYECIFMKIAEVLKKLVEGKVAVGDSATSNLAISIYKVAEPYNYEGAYLGELNYAITRFIQRVPQIMVRVDKWKDEFRYWLYAATVEALTCTAYDTRGLCIGVSGVFEDIKDEYKRRVNPAYEAAQILKSGDCYDTPYYTRLVEVVDEDGNLVGHQEVMLKRSEATLKQDLLDGRFVLKRKPQKIAGGGE